MPNAPSLPASTPATPASTPATPAKPPLFKLFIANIPWTADAEQLADHFSPCGTLLSCNIVVDKETGCSRGFGFVTFTTEQALKAALDMDGGEFQGRVLTVRVAENKGRKFGGPAVVNRAGKPGPVPVSEMGDTPRG
jgi:RNA recognition motif-containing protein